MTPSLIQQPSSSPTTPQPTIVGELQCGANVIGDFNDEDLSFVVQLTHYGDMTFDASATWFGFDLTA